MPSSQDTGYSRTETEAFTDLGALGWDEGWVEAFCCLGAAEELEPARVVRVDRGLPLIASARGLERAEPATHLLKSSTEATSRMVVGDWVALLRPAAHEMPVVEAILPRQTAFARRDPGEETGEQVLVANVDVALVTQSLSGEGVNLRRLERELVQAYASGARPVVVLSKSDLVKDAEMQRMAVAEIAPGVEIVVESAITGQGIEDVRAIIPTGTTGALLGPSGVGKSTLVNRLLGGEVQAVKEVRAFDDKGRHTTVAREMLLVPGGGVVIDTPGLRALALYDAEQGLADAFADIETLAEQCRFRDCTHTEEPGCAVIDAAIDGELSAARLASYRRLATELAELSRRRDEKGWSERERSRKLISKAAKRYFKEHPKK